MQIGIVSRCAVAALAVFGLALLGLTMAPEVRGEAAGFPDGRAGFVVADIGFAGAASNTVCPDGRSMGYREIYERSPEGRRREGESEEDYARRLDRQGRALAIVDGESLCMRPELGHDPHYRTMDDANVLAFGIDLDGQDSRANTQPAGGTCAHNDFRGPGGARGIDNQHIRLVGCSGGTQAAQAQEQRQQQVAASPRRRGSGLTVEMHTGAWGILISVSGVDDIANDDAVEVGIYANNDPIQLSGNREPVSYVTYAIQQDPRFSAVARGRIVDGVLTTDPVDVRFHHVLNGMRLERPLRDARMRATFAADGSLEGYIAGYTPIVEMYDVDYGFRNGKDFNGVDPAPFERRRNSAIGAAAVLGRTCEGVWAALQQLADGHRDPETGRCTSISTQYWFHALPAFVVDMPSEGVNDDLTSRPAR